MRRIRYLSFFILLLLFISYQESFTQTNDCSAPTTLNLDCNVSWDVVTANTWSSNSPTCYTAGGSEKDAWGTVTGDAGTGMLGDITLEYTTTQDAVLVVWTGTCGSLTTYECSDAVLGAGTETLTITDVDDGEVFYIQVIDKTPTASDMLGSICLYADPKLGHDLCSEALPINLGDCDFNFEITSTNHNNETDAADLTLAPNGSGINCVASETDAWMKFIATETGKVGFSYSVEDKDAAIKIYEATGTSCDALTLAKLDNTHAPTDDACVNYIAGAGKEVVEFSVTSGTTYYIRVMNVDALGGEMIGNACLYRIYGRNDCGDARPVIANNTCNLPINIPSYYDNNETDPDCGDADQDHDVWLTYTTSATATNVNLIYEGDVPVNMSVYPATITCGSLVSGDNELCLVGLSLSNVASVPVTASTSYYIRISTDAANMPTTQEGVRGQFCVYEGDNILSDHQCSSATTLLVDSECNPQTAVLIGGDVGDRWNVEYNSDPTNIDVICGPTSTLGNTALDGWVELDLTSYAGSGSTNDISIIYDNNNASPVVSSNVALEIRRLDALPSCVAGSESVGFNPITGVCIDDETGDPLQTGEGVEILTFNPSAQAGYAGYGAGIYPKFYVRVSNLDFDVNASIMGEIPSTVFGTICAFENVLQQGDLCIDPKPLVIGDCDIEMDIPTTFFNTESIADPACIGGKTISEDLWAEVTATSTSITLEYLNENGDVMIAAYKGSCGSLTAIDTDPSTAPIDEACADDVNGIGIEEITFPTVIGQTYYIRIMNVGATTNIDGRICIYNTAERDLCEDNELITLVPDACNINFKVRQEFELSGPQLTGACATTTDATHYPSGLNTTLYPSGVPSATHRDAFVKFVGKGGTMTVQYEANETNVDPVMVIYTAQGSAPGPINCGSGINGIGNLPNNELACVNGITGTGTQQTESIEFTSEAGRLYVLRIIDAASPIGQDMTGTLCIFEGPTGPDNCVNATAIDIVFPETGEDVGACNQQFSILSTNACNTSNPPIQCSGTNPNIYINTGGPAVTTSDGTSWESDDLYLISSGNSFTTGDAIDVTGPGTVDEVIYKSERWQNTLTYSIPITNGLYDVELHFAEIWATSNGVRVFDINIEGGAAEATGYDIHALEGHDKGRREEYVGFNVTDGTLDIVLSATANNAKISGIIIKPQTVSTPVCQGEAWFKFTTNSDPTKIPSDNITVQYDNTNNTFANAPDVSLEVYREVGTFDCTNNTTYQYIGCSDKLNDVIGVTEGIEEVNFNINTAGNETYFVRVINKESDKTVFGKLCIFYGETIARPSCVEAMDYGDLNGVWKNFTVDNSWTGNIMPGTLIDDCIQPGGSNPTSPNPPITSQGWFKFHIEDSATEDAFAVTVQHDNSTFSSTAQNSGNAGISVYRADNPLGPGAGGIDLPTSYPADVNECDFYDADGDGNYDGGPGKLTFIDCSENVWRGAESVTFTVEKGYWYFVRVMNVRNTNDMPGRVRVFKHTDCSLGPQLVVDGNFAEWPEIDASPNPTPTTWLGTSGMNNWILPNPEIQNYDQYGNTAALTVGDGKTLTTIQDIDHYTRFSTDYGYLIDRKRNNSLGNTLDNLRRKTGEFNPEGRYIVAHQSFTRKGGGFSSWDFYGYGNGETGQGGHNYSTYCDAGQPEANGEPCIGFGSPQVDRPALVPITADANYMAINGWWKTDGNTNPGKVWCQTVNILNGSDLSNMPNTDANPVDPTPQPRYFVFSAWFQNLIKSGTNLDVPQLRFTVCDMHDGTAVIDAGVVTSGNHPLGPNRTSPLPGVTYTPGYDSGSATWNAAKNPNELTVHYPQPPNNGNVLKASPIGFTFGAAKPCNTPSEPDNSRLKILGSDFLIPESPDEWVRVTCIYRAPPEVKEFNICIENLSLTKNGNDFAIDDISLQQCTPSTTNYLDDLLKGDACELSDEPTSIGLPLALNILDFTGKDIGGQVALSWTLLLDERITKFEIERSTTGGEFEEIGELDAEGTKNDFNTFRFNDRNLPAGFNSLYYRLKVWDDAGNAYYSNVVLVRLANTYLRHDLKIVPNPSEKGSTVSVEFFGEEGKAEVRVFDLLGELMLDTNFDTQKGINQFLLDTSGMPQGLYIVQVIHNGIRMSAKLIVK